MRYGLPKKILVPTDLSEVANAALKEAAALAKDGSAELIVLYADRMIPPLDPNMELPRKFAALTGEQKKEALTTYLRKKITDIVPQNIAVEPVVVLDAPVDAIITTANEKDADWIVMGTHGRSGAARVFQAR
ncbi:MAG TPA: universal stress protein [Thermoanaerobaculia bacterium]|nr:universal stress protein [Thermoanaerobaculia bacterium]